MAQPLTKRDKGAVLYTRPAAVEAAIDRALTLDLATLRRRLAIVDRRSPERLSSECLVHLIRKARRQDDQAKLGALLPVLISRCEANLLVKVPDGRLPNAAYIRDEILGQFGELLASDETEANPNDLDYFECRFNSAFRAFRIDLVRSETSTVNQAAPVPVEADEGEPNAYEDVFARVSKGFQTPATQESTLFLEDLWEAINSLPPDERKAVILCHVLGYKEESEDPEEKTAATACKVTGRTIRNRLARAAAKLSRFKEDA